MIWEATCKPSRGQALKTAENRPSRGDSEIQGRADAFERLPHERRGGALPGPGVTMDFEWEHSRKTVGKPAKSGGQSILKHLETNSSWGLKKSENIW
jgi:hypothetical protein